MNQKIFSRQFQPSLGGSKSKVMSEDPSDPLKKMQGRACYHSHIPSSCSKCAADFGYLASWDTRARTIYTIPKTSQNKIAGSWRYSAHQVGVASQQKSTEVLGILPDPGGPPWRSLTHSSWWFRLRRRPHTKGVLDGPPPTAGCFLVMEVVHGLGYPTGYMWLLSWWSTRDGSQQCHLCVSINDVPCPSICRLKQ